MASHSSTSPLTEYLEGNDIKTLVICGLATDVCVNATATDAILNGFKIILIKDALRGIDEGNTAKTFQELERKGAKVVQSVKDLRDLVQLI